jgi:hypothetical protein
MGNKTHQDLDKLISELEQFEQLHNTLPKRQTNWESLSASQRYEHCLRLRMSKLEKGISFRSLLQDQDVARLTKIGVNLHFKDSSIMKYEMYKTLINELLLFALEHKRMPKSSKKSSVSECKLYRNYYALSHGLIHKLYFSKEDKAMLSAAGYQPNNQERYQSLKSQLLEFIATHNREPKLSAQKPITDLEILEYNLASRLYKLKSGRTFNRYLSTSEIEELELAGINME